MISIAQHHIFICITSIFEKKNTHGYDTDCCSIY